jgi:crotonobetaine/carnitine-CoA ligase
MKSHSLPNENILDLLINTSKKSPNHILFIENEKKITRKEFIEKILKIKGGLKKRGLKKGDKVLSILENSYEEIILFFACITSGIIWIPLGSERKGVGLRYIIELTKTKIIFSQNLKPNNLPKNLFRKILKINKNLKNLEADENFFNILDLSKLSCIIFTSGTTGPPKGVMVSQKMLLTSAYSTGIAADINKNDKLLLWESLYHIGGLEIIVLALLENITIIIKKKFSSTNFWTSVRKYKISKLHYLGGILDILLKLKKNKSDKKHNIKIGFGAGARSDVVTKFKRRFNIKLREVYGMTEASSFTTINFNQKKNSIGKALPWFDVKIKKKFNNDRVGEILINEKINGLLTEGYYNDKNATKELLKKDGLHTGDIAKKDINGNYFYIGREKDSVRVRGENISAWEIETTLNKKEFISESTILKTKAEIGENDIIALIIPKTNILNIKQIVKNCEKDLSKNYLPRYWCLMEKFPRTPSLRIDKKNINITKLKLYDRLIDKLIEIQRL